MRKLMQKREGFTLIELMIVVAIIGILAAIAIPAFINYIKRSKTTEAGVQLKAMYAGASTYYDGERGMQGIVAPGAGVVNVTRCTVPTATSTNAPTSQKTVLDWNLEANSFKDLGFSPADPIYYQYTVTAGGTAAGACGDMSVAGAAIYTFTANGDLDDDGTQSTFELAVGVNGEGNLYSGGTIFVPTGLELE